MRYRIKDFVKVCVLTTIAAFYWRLGVKWRFYGIYFLAYLYTKTALLVCIMLYIPHVSFVFRGCTFSNSCYCCRHRTDHISCRSHLHPKVWTSIDDRFVLRFSPCVASIAYFTVLLVSKINFTLATYSYRCIIV